MVNYTINSGNKDLSRPDNRASASSDSARHTLLLVEEDVALASFLSQELQTESLAVEVVHDGEAAWNALRHERRYDLLILDLNLPKLDGMTLLQRVRPTRLRMPIMVLTSRSSIEDKVLAFQSGADDFLAKPFSFAELLARVGALLRRHSGVIPNTTAVGDLTLHREERKVERNGRRIDLTPREYSIVEYMLRHVGHPVSRATLCEEVWNMPHNSSTNIVDVYMKYVRDKVDGPGERKLTHTIRGIGYEFRDDRDIELLSVDRRSLTTLSKQG
jgi:DNA-binding response OmpR family regulator